MNLYSTSIQYFPIPPRVWSRVQNPCSVTTDPAASSNFARAEYDRQMLLKGNILQYKKNSSNLTKKQRYTQIAKGMWTNRTKTWATQSDTYTNPNTTSLLRVNSTIVDPSNNVFSSPPNPFGCPTTSIPDGGNLVCNVVVDPCSQEVIKRTKSQQLCNPTTDSDVPGRIQQLCWNDGTQTWYPRQRYTMSTSGDKWPVNYKFLVSALRPASPVLTLVSINDDSVTLSWTVIDNDCIPISSFNIYDNGRLLQIVPYPSLTATVYNLDNCSNNVFYVTSVSNTTQSEPSNSVEAYINILYGPVITSINSTCDGGITLTWVPPSSSSPCSPDVDYYTIYQENVPTYSIDAVQTSFTITTGLDSCTTYNFYMTATFTNYTTSLPSEPATIGQAPCAPSISASVTGSDQVTITLSVITVSICTILSYTIYQDGVSTYTGVQSPAVINGLTPGQTYSFEAISVGSSFSSGFSNTESVLVPKLDAPTITSIEPCYKQATISWTEPPEQNPAISSYTIHQTGYSSQDYNVSSGTFTFTILSLINGQTYFFQVTATNIEGNESLPSLSETLPMPSTSTYFTPSGTQSGTDYIITFTSTGTLTYSSSCPGVSVNCSLLLVGGGGGGAGSNTQATSGTPYTSGGGGGGGFVTNVYNCVFSTASNVVTVGGGGGGGPLSTASNGGPGGTSSFLSTYTAPGGSGGSRTTGGPGYGKGGNGIQSNGVGFRGTDGLIPSYGGGGGGGGYNSSQPYFIVGGGSAGYNGSGGDGGSSSQPPSANGQDAATVGSGGGGASFYYDPSTGGTPTGGSGGDGFRGVVIFTIPN
jgi:hypothetical protein